MTNRNDPPHLKRFYAAVDQLLEDATPAEAICAATTLFVSLFVNYAKAQGADVNQPIRIDGGDQRDITIHPPKRISK